VPLVCNQAKVSESLLGSDDPLPSRLTVDNSLTDWSAPAAATGARFVGVLFAGASEPPPPHADKTSIPERSVANLKLVRKSIILFVSPKTGFIVPGIYECEHNDKRPKMATVRSRSVFEAQVLLNFVSLYSVRFTISCLHSELEIKLE